MNLTSNSNFEFSLEMFDRTTIQSIQSVNLPSLSLGNISSAKDSQNLYFQSDTISFSNLDISILISEDLSEYKQIQEMFYEIRNQETGLAEKNFQINNSATLTIKDEHSHKTILKVIFENLMIESIGDLSLSTTEDDDEVSLDISFVFDTLSFEWVESED